MKNLSAFLIVILVGYAFTTSAQDKEKDFYGMWTLDIEGGSVGWLNVNEDKGFLDADLLLQQGFDELLVVVEIAHHDLAQIVDAAAHRPALDDLRDAANCLFEALEILGAMVLDADLDEDDG